MISSYILATGLLGIILTVGGAIYRYMVKKNKLSERNIATLTALSFGTSLAIIYMLGSIVFCFFNNAGILHFGVDDLKLGALAAYLFLVILAVYRYIKFIIKGK